MMLPTDAAMTTRRSSLGATRAARMALPWWSGRLTRKCDQTWESIGRTNSERSPIPAIWLTAPRTSDGGRRHRYQQVLVPEPDAARESGGRQDASSLAAALRRP